VVTTGKVKWRVPAYVAAAVAVATALAGFALGSISIGGSHAIQQGSETSTISPVEGLTWESTTLVQEASISNTNCVSSPGCSLDAASAIWCGNPCGNSNDYFEQVIFGVDAGGTAIICGTADTTVSISLSYTVGSTVTAQTPGYFYDTSAASGSTTITLYIDITSGGAPQAVTQVTTIANCL
jgi:hypothetical protein